MHLVALTHLFSPARGGTENALLDLTKRLVKKGHRVTVVTSNQICLEDFEKPQTNPSLPREEFKEGIRIIRLPLSPRQRFICAKTGALALRSGLRGGETLWFRTHLPFLPQMIKTAQELDPDLVYAVPFPTASIYYASAAAKKIGCPWVIQPHLHFNDLNASLITIIHRIFPKASAILTNTQAEKNYLVQQGLQDDTIHPLGQGLDLALLKGGKGDRFRSAYGLTDEPLILFLGRKVQGKGIDILLDAMPLIWKEESRAVLILAGRSSPYFKTLYGGHSLSKDSRIISLDDFPDEKKMDLLAACDLLILPSQVESFGVVFLEAWTKGKPVIGASIPAIAEMIDQGEDGFLVPYGDRLSLAAAAIKLIKNPVLRKTMGEKGKLKVQERFEIGRITDRMEALFLSLIKS
jgi:glycosyltransferase involved in cell wall biosynthesis